MVLTISYMISTDCKLGLFTSRHTLVMVLMEIMPEMNCEENYHLSIDQCPLAKNNLASCIHILRFI